MQANNPPTSPPRCSGAHTAIHTNSNSRGSSTQTSSSRSSRSTSKAQPSPETIVDALLSQYHALPKRGKPQPHESTILAGMQCMVLCTDIHTFTVVHCTRCFVVSHVYTDIHVCVCVSSHAMYTSCTHTITTQSPHDPCRFCA